MSRFTEIDLSRLPLPDVLVTVDFDQVFAELRAELIMLAPELGQVIELESDPLNKALRVWSYREITRRALFNEQSKRLFLATSFGTSLDNLAAFYGVARLTVIEAIAAQSDGTPAQPAVLETDAAFRRRVQLALEGQSTAGPVGSYIFWALSADGRVKSVDVISPAPGEVLVTVLSHEDDGTVDAELLGIVNATLNSEDVRPLTDSVTVQSATIVPFTVEATLTFYNGPDRGLVLDTARAALEVHVAEHHRMGHDITLSGLYAALHQPGVMRVDLVGPAADIVIDVHEAAYCTSINLTDGGTDV